MIIGVLWGLLDNDGTQGMHSGVEFDIYIRHRRTATEEPGACGW